MAENTTRRLCGRAVDFHFSGMCVRPPYNLLPLRFTPMSESTHRPTTKSHIAQRTSCVLYKSVRGRTRRVSGGGGYNILNYESVSVGKKVLHTADFGNLRQ